VPICILKLVPPSIIAAAAACAAAGPAVALPPNIVNDPDMIGLNELLDTIETPASVLKSSLDADNPV
jgi:hypothetical protein